MRIMRAELCFRQDIRRRERGRPRDRQPIGIAHSLVLFEQMIIRLWIVPVRVLVVLKLVFERAHAGLGGFQFDDGAPDQFTHRICSTERHVHDLCRGALRNVDSVLGQDPSGIADRGSAGRDVMGDDCVCADPGAVANGNVAENFEPIPMSTLFPIVGCRLTFSAMCRPE